MQLNLSGRTVVVTGGSRGIGLACARVFLEEGCRVALIARDRTRLEGARGDLAVGADRLMTHAADLVDPAAAIAAIAVVEERFGFPDVLVNSAGAARRCDPRDLSTTVYRQAMDAKYFTYINAIDAVIAGMAARSQGVIVNIIGSGGKTASVTHIAGGAANAALMLVTAGLAAAYASQGLRIVGINPGRTATSRTDESLALEGRLTGKNVQEVTRRILAQIPMARFALPDDVARMAAFLASDAASYVTGCSIPMDGALSTAI
jgi:NAD(P)-dependent dehydrogenase (short-subunit alcohol dehydrogenase family)